MSAAGRAMNMSYRRAWLFVDEINRICGQAVVETQEGGKRGGGAELTSMGLSLVTRYRKIEWSVEIAARKELRALRADLGKDDSEMAAGAPSIDSQQNASVALPCAPVRE